MRWLFILLLFCCANVKAQVISVRVLADTSGQPLTATITNHSGHQTSSNAIGEFTIPVSGVGDTLKIFAMGYKPYFYTVKSLNQELVIIRLKQASVMLKGVAIKALRDHKKDSVANRKDYGRVFNYQPPKLTDAFISPPSNVPFAFVSIDLLTLFNVINKKNDPSYKFKKQLLLDEQADYIATRFNRGLVTRVTQLKSDSLDQFMLKYYPTADWVKRTSDYDIIQYIRTKAVEFRTAP
jgi:hypothetical protein